MGLHELIAERLICHAPTRVPHTNDRCENAGVGIALQARRQAFGCEVTIVWLDHRWEGTPSFMHWHAVQLSMFCACNPLLLHHACAVQYTTSALPHLLVGNEYNSIFHLAQVGAGMGFQLGGGCRQGDTVGVRHEACEHGNALSDD